MAAGLGDMRDLWRHTRLAPSAPSARKGHAIRPGGGGMDRIRAWQATRRLVDRACARSPPRAGESLLEVGRGQGGYELLATWRKGRRNRPLARDVGGARENLDRAGLTRACAAGDMPIGQAEDGRPGSVPSGLPMRRGRCWRWRAARVLPRAGGGIWTPAPRYRSDAKEHNHVGWAFPRRRSQLVPDCGLMRKDERLPASPDGASGGGNTGD